MTSADSAAHRPADVDELPSDAPRSLGDYELIGLLGRGGMGSVYLGRNAAGRLVAVKVIRPELASDSEFLRLFHREARLARRVARFCTAEVLDVGEEDGRPFLVTEYVDGPTLWDAVGDDGPLTGSQLDRIAVAVATALTAVHGAGTVHRDLKPNNVMLSKSGPLVIDFGIAHALDGTTHLTSLGAGTPAFMAPEQARGEPVTAAADIFAWGGIVVFAATGKPPFGSGRPEVMLYRVVHGQPDLDGVPQPLRDVVAAAMRSEPADRPTALELVTLLTTGPSSRPTPPAAKTDTDTDEEADADGTVRQDKAQPAALTPAPGSGDDPDDDVEVTGPQRLVLGPPPPSIAPVRPRALGMSPPAPAEPAAAPGSAAAAGAAAAGIAASARPTPVLRSPAPQAPPAPAAPSSPAPSPKAVPPKAPSPNIVSPKSPSPHSPVPHSPGSRPAAALAPAAPRSPAPRSPAPPSPGPRSPAPGSPVAGSFPPPSSSSSPGAGDLVALRGPGWGGTAGHASGPPGSFVPWTANASSRGTVVAPPPPPGPAPDRRRTAARRGRLVLATSLVVAALLVAGAVVANAKLSAGDRNDPLPTVTTEPTDDPVTPTDPPPDEVETVTVPDVERLTQDDAVSALEDLGLTATYNDPVRSSTVPMDSVVEQDPAGGSTADKGSEVRLTLSGGAGDMELVRVPDVVGNTEDTARGRVSDANLSPNVRREAHDTVAEGTVVSTSPSAGTKVRLGGAVTIVVSTGPAPPAQVTVPSDLVGLDYATARQRLVDLGLAVTRTDTTSATVPAEQVISSSPAGGAKVDVGSSVQLTVSTGPKKVTVPDVTGMTLSTAESALRNAGLVPSPSQEWNFLPASAVVDHTTPAAGSQVAEGSTVSLTPAFTSTSSPATSASPGSGGTIG